MANQTGTKTAVDIPMRMVAFRILVAGLIAAHGWARMLAGAVDPFGSFLEAQGFPAGILIAWFITLLEIVGTVLVVFGSWLTPYLCMIYALIYLAGIVLVHAAEGWFVVGLGRNGMEYSVLLIGCLVLVGHAHLSPEQRAKFGFARKITDN